MNMKKTGYGITAFIICTVAAVFMTGCGEKPAEQNEASQVPETEAQTEPADTPEENMPAETDAPHAFEISSVSSFVLTSESISDGVWNPVITNTAGGSNVSPQLSWEPVENADGYAVYMIDTSAKNWMHWKSADVKETELAEGWADKTEYIGPYPPGGTHTYDIYVFALKNSPEEISGMFDKSNDNFMSNWQDIMTSLDSADGRSGNIISYGYLSGTYTAGE